MNLVSARPIRAVIVDDEAPARALLAEYLDAEPRLELVAQCANGYQAVKAVAEHAPDLLLLDVQMPKLDGFEVLELLTEPRPAVIFVTDIDQYALDAFSVHAIDYLLKPVDPQRLHRAIDRLVARDRGQEAATAAPHNAMALRAAVGPGPGIDRILVRDGARIHVIPTERLDYIEAQDDCVAIAADGHKRRKQGTLHALGALLDPSRFVRVHRSYILNVERLARIELYAKDSRVAILRDGTRLPISRAGYARLRRWL